MTVASILRPDRPMASPAVGAAVGPGRARVAAPGWIGQLVRFGVVGGGASALQLAAYAFLADSVGSQVANVAAWLVSTLMATEAHRRFSFGGSHSGSEGDHAVGIVTSLLALLLSSVALAALDDPSGATGVLALVGVNVVVGVLRFAILRWWMVGRASLRRVPPVVSSASGSLPGR